MRGYVHLYPRAHINTDEIIPARYLNVHDEAELAKHAMEDIDPDFVNKVKPGDFIIAGEDFGCGSSREHAIWALRGAGIQAVIASSFSRIFFRNAVNNGYLPIECKGIAEKVSNGNELEVDVKGGRIHNLTKGEVYEFVPISDFAMKIIEAGGLLQYINQKSKIKNQEMSLDR